MKKLLFTMAVAAVAIVAGCTRVDENGFPFGKNTLHVTSDEATRTEIVTDDNVTFRHNWVKGDAIALFDAGKELKYELVGEGGSTTGDFTGPAPAAQTPPYYAFYPYSENIDIYNDPGVQSKFLYEFPSEIEYEGGQTVGSNVMIGFTDNNSLTMKNACSYVRVAISSPFLAYLDEIEIIARGGENIAGPHLVGITPQGVPFTEFYRAATANGTTAKTYDRVSVKFPTTKHIDARRSFFYIPLPAVELSDGLTFILKGDFGGEATMNLTSSTATLERNTVLVMEEYRFPSEEAKIGDVVYETIGDAFAAANASNENCTITLLRSCAAAARLPLNDAGTGEITLDLRGKTLTMTNQIRVTGRKLTITDSFSDDPAQQGGIISTYNEGRVIYLEGAESECVINAGKIVSKNYGAIWLAGFLTLEGTASVTCETGIAVYLNGPEARMIFRGDASITAKSNAIALYGGKTVDVSGNVKAYSADGATFYPEVGTINISGGNFRRGGTGNGYVVYTAGPSSVVNISGGTFENFSAANANPTVSATSNGGSVYVTGGYFNSYGVNPVYCAGSDAAGGFCEVKGGCFNKGIQPRFAASGYVNVLNEDPATKDTYPFTVAPGETAAVLTQGSYIYNYGSLESGFTGANQRALANGNSLLTLQKDITAASTVNVNSDNGYSVTLDLNGHKVSSSANPAISSANTFIITDTGSEGDFATSGAVAVEITAGSTTVNSASLFGANNAFEVKGGSLKINNGYINGGGTSDIAVSGGTVTIGGGWYAHEPNASYIVDGCGSKPEYLSYNGRSFGYHIIATKFAATVNDEGYATLEAAVNAAKTYNGSASTVVIKLMESTECNVALDMTNASGKPVTFDLNGQTLTTTVSQFISAANEFLLTDSSANPGTIESNNTRVIYLHAAGGAGTATVEKVTIKSTFDKSTNSDATASANSAVYIYSNSSATKTLNLKNGAKIITPKCHGIYAGGNGNSTPSFLNVENAEITSGMYCLYFATATIEISGDETSLVSSDLEGKRAIYCGSSNANAKCHITGGYFYNGDGTTSAINTNYASHITIGGGYYCAALDGKYKLDSGFTLQDCNVTHTHKTTGTSLTYKKKIAK